MRHRDTRSGSGFWIKAILFTLIMVVIYRCANSKIDQPDLIKSGTSVTAIINSTTSGLLNLNELSRDERKNYTGKGEYEFLFKTKKYKGDWVNGLPSGSGEMWFSNGDCYKGEFHKGVLYGQAVMRFASGSVYSGAYVKNKRHGYGKMVYPNSTIQEGYWENDRFIGVLSGY